MFDLERRLLRPELASAGAVEPVGLVWRQGLVADVPPVARFAASAFDPAFREAWSEGQIAGMLADKNAWLDIAEGAQTGNAVAAFALSRLILDEVELLLCATSPVMRRQGLGRRLVRQVCDSARARGASRVFLEVRASNVPARALYDRTGFVSAGRRSGYYRSVSGESVDAITLAFSL